MTTSIGSIAPNETKFPKVLRVPDTVPANIHAWSFKSTLAPTETAKAYARFRRFMEMGEGRLLSKLAIEYGVSLPVISRAASKYHWVSRIAAYEEWVAIKAAEEERDERHREHIERLASFRTRSEQMGTGLLSTGAQVLSVANQAIQDMKARGDVMDMRLLASALGAAAKCVTEGRNLTAQSLALEALLSGIDDAGNELDSFD